MDFEFSEEDKMFRAAIRDFAQKEIAPLVEEAEEKEKFPRHLFPKAGDLGYLCVRYPEEYGGPGVGKVTECIYTEELHKICVGIAGGLMLGVMRVSRFAPVRGAATAYTELIRGTPLLMQLIVLY